MSGIYVKSGSAWTLAFLGTAPFNAASGGTESTFTWAGTPFKRHLFTTAGAASLSITSAARPFRITMIAGGGESGYADALAGEGSPGGSGGGYFGYHTLSAGALSMQVGIQCAGANINVSANDTTITGIGTCGGGGHGRREWNSTGQTNGRTGTWGGASTGGNGQIGGAYVTPNDPSLFFRSLLDGTAVTYGKYGAGHAANTSGTNPGIDGMICIEYETG